MNKYKLFEIEPAKIFEDAHLLGNGSLGASVYGGVPCEQILINCDTLWSGQEKSKINEGTREHLELARTLMLEDRLKEANNLINDEMLGYWSEAYQPLGSLYITLGHTEDLRSMKQTRTLLNESPYESYSRILSLDEAVERIEYEQKGVHYTREFFVSHEESVVAVKLTAKGGPLEFSMGMDSPLRHEAHILGDTVAVTGRAPDRVECYLATYSPKVVYMKDEQSDAVRFAAAARVINTDGKLYHDEFRLFVSGATYAVILLSADTNYAGYKLRRDRNVLKVLEKCINTVHQAATKTYDMLQQAHISDYQKLYGRFSLDLGDAITEALPTSQRLKISSSIDDPSIPALAVQYSRYLLIAFSRPGSQAGNLQGIWNPEIRPPWACNYTTNINVQMNYWGAEQLALSECHLPLSDLVRELADSGREAAKELYNMHGWVAHHNTDLWRMATLAGEDAAWAWWAFGGIWLCQHLWQHYEFTRDLDYLLDTVYPVIKGAVEFVLDFVIADRDGTLVTAPSTSPENKFFLPGGSIKEALASVSAWNRFSSNQNNICAVCKASTMDLAMIREVLGNFKKASELLKMENEFDEKINETLAMLKPFQIGRHGQLQEWDEDFEECTPGMGHVSHLYSVYPAAVINATETPELFDAAHKSLIRRSQHGGMKQHWPGSWGICLYARFRDGVICNQINSSIGDGLSANLLTKNSWQMDCIMGWGAGVAEMLLQSQEGFLSLLPALAPSWMKGSVKGICARGGFTIDLEWEQGRLSRATISSQKGGRCMVRYNNLEADIAIPAGCIVTLDGALKQV